MPPAPQLIALGTYTKSTGGRGPGVRTLWWTGDPATSTFAGTAAIASPSFLCAHPSLPLIYAVGELDQGVITTIAVDNGQLSVIDEQPTGSSAPCHLAFTPDGRHLVIAGYGSGDLTVFGVNESGRLTGRTELLAHQGRGPHPIRQDAPHVHQVVAAPDGEMLACDLGNDTITGYRVQPDGTLSLRDLVNAPEGSGPRHLALSADGETAYVTAELDSGLLWYERDGQGPWVLRYRVPSTGPVTPLENNLPSHVAFTADEQYLLVANRGNDVLSVFDVGGGEPIFVGDAPTGRNPRHFSIVGDHVLVAAQDDDAITVLRLDEYGTLTPADSLDLGSPTCILPLS
ncbi:lactonase family protein [Nakamurella alba]|nr:beta-propeller fold lactonase family protein [Nakamurella alba]